MTDATHGWQLDEDTVATFVAEACLTSGPNRQDLHVRVSELRASYERWCQEMGATPVSAKALTVKLAELGVQRSRSADARFYDGIRLDDLDKSRDDR